MRYPFNILLHIPCVTLTFRFIPRCLFAVHWLALTIPVGRIVVGPVEPVSEADPCSNISFFLSYNRQSAVYLLPWTTFPGRFYMLILYCISFKYLTVGLTNILNLSVVYIGTYILPTL